MSLLAAARLAAVTIAITTPADESPTVNGNCTLREAIAAAQSNAAQDLCPAGSDVEPDVVLLLAGPHSWNNGYVFQSSIGGALVLRGPAETPPTALVNIDPVLAGRFMRVLTGADLTIENVDIRNGDSRLNQSTRSGGAITASDVVATSLTLRNVVLLGNRAGFGGGLYFETSSSAPGPSSLVIERSLIEGNLAEINDIPGTARGGGVFLQLRGPTTARIVDSAFYFNRAASTLAGNDAWAGGLYVGLSDQATFEMRRVDFVGNEADAGPGNSPWGAGAVLWPWGTTTMRLADLRFEANDLIDPFATASGYPPSALEVFSGFSGSFEIDGLEIVGNDIGDAAADLRLQVGNGIPSLARNVLVARGAQRGVRAASSGALTLGHFTVTGHATQGIELLHGGPGELRLENSIVFGNGTNVVTSGAPTVDPSSLVGTDPMFENSAGDNYRLAAGSPAIDFGDQTLASVGFFDLDHAPRVAGLDTDAGAYERDALFADDFESADTGAWSATAP